LWNLNKIKNIKLKKMKTQNRRSIFKKMFAGFLGITGATVAANATPNSSVDANGKEVFLSLIHI
jgi:hypothetical protein